MTVCWGASNGGNQMVETMISRERHEELKEQAAQEGTTPEAVLDKALTEFIRQNEQ